MYETVSVDDALARGRKMVNLPIYAILFLPAIISFVLVIAFKWPGWIIAIAFGVGFVLGWLYWSLTITRWRIWAFDNVRNVHELKKRAIKEKLIWADDSFWIKTEIRSAADKEKLAALEVKFNKPDVFIDDYAVPAETQVHYSKGKTRSELALWLVFFAGGLFMGIAYKPVWGAVICVVIGFMIYLDLKKVRNTNAQVILNNEGIQTEATPFYHWRNVSHEDVIAEQAGKDVNLYLVYNNPESSVKLNIADYDISRKELEKLLRIYRGRSGQKVL